MPESSPNRSVMIVLAYLWLLALVPLLFDRDDVEVQWHARHGIVLMVAELAAFFLYMVLTMAVSFASLGLGVFLVAMLVIAWVGMLAIHVGAIVKGLNGTRLMIPRLSEYAARW